jgi:hypothetical protein
MSIDLGGSRGWAEGASRMVTLIVRKTVRATPERLFAAWTSAEQLKEGGDRLG